MIGITKRALFEDYYIDEIGEIIYEHNELHRVDRKDELKEEVTGDAFFGF